jgi:flagellar biosynthesis chaperone FliJ
MSNFNLVVLKREVERLKNLARERSDICVCRYIEIVKGATLTEEQERVLENNRECYERNHDQRAHVGWSYIEVPPAALK